MCDTNATEIMDNLLNAKSVALELEYHNDREREALIAAIERAIMCARNVIGVKNNILLE